MVFGSASVLSLHPLLLLAGLSLHCLCSCIVSSACLPCYRSLSLSPSSLSFLKLFSPTFLYLSRHSFLHFSFLSFLYLFSTLSSCFASPSQSVGYRPGDPVGPASLLSLLRQACPQRVSPCLLALSLISCSPSLSFQNLLIFIQLVDWRPDQLVGPTSLFLLFSSGLPPKRLTYFYRPLFLFAMSPKPSPFIPFSLFLHATHSIPSLTRVLVNI